MIDLRRGIARIGYVLLTLWESGWLATIAWAQFSGATHWSSEAVGSLFLLLIGYPFGIFLLWRLFLWILSGFIRVG